MSKIEKLPVLSLQTGETVAWLLRSITDISTLQVPAFLCKATDGNTVVLLGEDIRQLAADCIIIDNEEELAQPEDLVRLQTVIQAAYNPLRKRVVSDIGRKLGSVEDYNINLASGRIDKLYLKQPLFQQWLGQNLIIDRTQILDVTPQRIVVRDTTQTAPIVKADTIPEIHP